MVDAVDVLNFSSKVDAVVADVLGVPDVSRNGCYSRCDGGAEFAGCGRNAAEGIDPVDMADATQLPRNLQHMPPIPDSPSKIAHKKWPIPPFSPASHEIASKNAGYFNQNTLQSTFPAE